MVRKSIANTPSQAMIYSLNGVQWLAKRIGQHQQKLHVCRLWPKVNHCRAGPVRNKTGFNVLTVTAAAIYALCGNCPALMCTGKGTLSALSPVASSNAHPRPHGKLVQPSPRTIDDAAGQSRSCFQPTGFRRCWIPP